MKVFVFAIACLLAVSGALGDNCYNDVSMDCGQGSSSLALPRCNAVYGEYAQHGNVAKEMQAYGNLYLERSYEYLLSSAFFNNYQTNRAGFSKMFKKLSDDAWEKSIDIIKHVTMRDTGKIKTQARRISFPKPECVEQSIIFWFTGTLKSDSQSANQNSTLKSNSESANQNSTLKSNSESANRSTIECDNPQIGGEKTGDTMDFNRRSTAPTGAKKNYTVELHELQALAKALDTQKELAERAFYIHREATRNSQHLHDPEIAQYLEEEFVEDQAKTIRDLAGHTSDLKQFITAHDGQDLSIALYLFDEYLQKTV